MKYLYYGLLSGLFLVYALEVPFDFLKVKSNQSIKVSCCCKSSIVCACGHKICHLNKQTPANTKSTFLSALGCGFLKDKSAASSYYKEFHPISCSNVFIRKAFSFFPLNRKYPRILLLDLRVDKPPAIVPYFSR